MSARRPVWRAIEWIERFLPTPAPLAPGADRSSARRRAAFVPLLILPAVTLPNLLRTRIMTAEAWPAWRPMILDMLLIVAGAIIVAGLAFGVHAWRQARRDTNA